MSYVQPHLQDRGIDAATIEQLPSPLQAVIKGVLPKAYFKQVADDDNPKNKYE